MRNTNCSAHVFSRSSVSVVQRSCTIAVPLRRCTCKQTPELQLPDIVWSVESLFLWLQNSPNIRNTRICWVSAADLQISAPSPHVFSLLRVDTRLAGALFHLRGFVFSAPWNCSIVVQFRSLSLTVTNKQVLGVVCHSAEALLHPLKLRDHESVGNSHVCLGSTWQREMM